MKSVGAEAWGRAGETALLALVFLAPLAAHSRTYDPAALKTALFESCALALAAAWLLKGLARGRWEAAAASLPALAPVLALAAWTVVRFAAAPFKSAALPDLVLALSAWAVYAVALLEFGGARSAARLAFWTAAAAVLVGALGAAQRFSFGPGLAATLTSPDQLASFAAVALPVVLALRLDPEASRARRLLSASTAAALALLAAWSGSARGLAAFALSALAFAAAAASLLRGSAPRRAALIALACAAAAVLVAASGAGFPVEDAARVPGVLARVLAGNGLAGAALLGWTLLAATACGLRAALGLRRRGALAEAGYAAAFAAAFGAWALCAAAGLVPGSGAGAWLAWAAAGVAAGMAPLARPRGTTLVLPLPFGEDARRRLQGPALVLFACLAVWPGGWLASDVRYNRAVAEARAGGLDAALVDAGRAWPGSPVYASALYLRGRVLMEQDKPREALAAYARLDRVSPDFSRVHGRRAEAYAALGDWPASARERERQGALTPLDLGNLTAWAEAARAAGDLAEARRAAARARALAPGDASVRLQVAANALLEKRAAERDAASRGHGRKGLAFKSRPKPR